MIKALQDAVRGFHAEYGHYPKCEANEAADHMIETSDGVLARILTGQDPDENPRGIMFVELPAHKRRVPGMVADGSFAILDQYGHGYRVWIDADNDGRIANPDKNNANEQLQMTSEASIPVTCMIQSAGKDGIFDTADDCSTWHRPLSKPNGWTQWERPNGLVPAILFAVLFVGCWKALRYYSRLRHNET